MTNVLYPFLDLTSAVLQLLNSLKGTDWAKITLFQQQKVSDVAVLLLQNHLHGAVGFDKDFQTAIPLGGANVPFNLQMAALEDALKCFVNETTQRNEVQKAYNRCWLLQQYVRQALNDQFLLTRRFYFPFLAEVMQALAQHYQNVAAQEGSILKIEIVGEAGGVWCIQKRAFNWQFTNANPKSSTTIVYLDQQIAWLLFTGNVVLNEIGAYYQIMGDRQLGSHFLSIRI